MVMPAPLDRAGADPAAPREWLIAALRLLGRPLPDALYLRFAHWLFYRRWPRFDRPRSLQEHIQAYYLLNRDPDLVMLADKIAVRRYIAAHVGAEFTVPMLGAWDCASAVPLATLPYPLVLKPSHMSGRILLLASHRPECEAARRARLREWLRRDHSRVNREWYYAHIPRRVIAEPLLLDDCGEPPPDIKAYVIGGRVRYFQVDRGRFDRPTRNLYGPDWQLLPVRTTLPRHASDPPPGPLGCMLDVAERLAARFEFLRVDFYVIGERLLVGELTSSPGAGFGRFYPQSFADSMAQYWPAERPAKNLPSVGVPLPLPPQARHPIGPSLVATGREPGSA
jgi:TupA-like ATPgrasp